jgi:undecaprenyl-diphosphatase
MTSITEAILLGVIQGITEWLPVSSSGHLVLAQYFLGVREAVEYDAFLHVATFLVALAYFREDVKKILADTLKAAESLIRKKKVRKTKNLNLAFLILVASIPTGIIGIAFKDVLESLYSDVQAAALGLIITGIFLAATKVERKPVKLDWASAGVIGLAQGLSIVPAISRSGATISTALYLGVPKETAAKFSFLILLPAAVGGIMLESKGMTAGLRQELVPYTIGFAASLIVGYISLDFLMKIVKNGKLHYFAYYVIPLGVISILTSIYFI